MTVERNRKLEPTSAERVRYILTAAKPVTQKVTPFLIGGVLTTWNSAHDFGVDKIRLGGGLALKISEESLMRFTYMLEENRFTDPIKRTNIFWVRDEMVDSPDREIPHLKHGYSQEIRAVQNSIIFRRVVTDSTS